MAQEDWTELTGSLTAPSVARVATPAIPPPPSDFDKAFVMHSRVATSGVLGYFVNEVDFAPAVGDQAIEGVLYRQPGPSGSGVSNFLFAALQGTDTTSSGYMIGLSDSNPSRIVLAKARPQDGLQNVAPDPDNNGILLRGTQDFAVATWVHVRLEIVVNANGDVFVKPLWSDLDLHLVTAPVWQTPEGMDGILVPAYDGFLDDFAQTYSGSAPFGSGRLGYGAKFTDISRIAAFDHVRVEREV